MLRRLRSQHHHQALNPAERVTDIHAVTDSITVRVIRVYDVAGNVIDDIGGSYTPLNLLELNRTALSDKRSGRREYRTCNSFSKVK